MGAGNDSRKEVQVTQIIGSTLATTHPAQPAYAISRNFTPVASSVHSKLTNAQLPWPAALGLGSMAGNTPK